MSTTIPALEALFSPLRAGHIAVPRKGRALFLRASADAPFATIGGSWVCEQDHKPQADALLRAGMTAIAEPAERFELVMLLPSRQRAQTRADLVAAASRLAPRCMLVLAAANNEGARSLQSDTEALLGPLQVESTNKCRVIWGAPDMSRFATDLADEWIRAAAAVEVPGTGMLSRPGVFSWDRIDIGSALLASQLPATLHGAGADLGAGWGYLSAHLLRQCAQIERLDVYEADARALEMARTNLQALSGAVVKPSIEYLWYDVAAGLERRYDFIVSNPPFHVGRADAPDLGRQFIHRASEALRVGGSFWMVANRHLPYEAELGACFAEVHKRTERQGFKVFEAIR